MKIFCITDFFKCIFFKTGSLAKRLETTPLNILIWKSASCKGMSSTLLSRRDIRELHAPSLNNSRDDLQISGWFVYIKHLYTIEDTRYFSFFAIFLQIQCFVYRYKKQIKKTKGLPYLILKRLSVFETVSLKNGT